MLRSSCSCTAPLMLRDGVVVCGRCGAAIGGEHVAEYSSVRLPPDAKNRASFNRACRRGDVKGAVKAGRCWVCSADAWRARTAPATPSIATQRSKPLRVVDDEVLGELGARRTA